MSNLQPVKFLLHQLTNNEQDRDNLNLILPAKLRCHLSMDDGLLEFGDTYNSSQPFESLEEIYQEKIIRACPSRVEAKKQCKECRGTGGWINRFDHSRQNPCFACNSKSFVYSSKAVLGVFNKLSHTNHWLVYSIFSFTLWDGKPLDTAISAFHDKMLELVPEYREFLNNNK